MNKLAKTVMALSAAALFEPAGAEISSNVSVVSNYLFRGVTQTDDGAALQGGFDFSDESGLYAGTWLSNVDFGGKEDAEVDLYAGFGGDFGSSGFSYDIGALYYLYPGGGNLDYGEIYAGLGYGLVSASVAYTVYGEVEGPSAFDSGDVYYNIGVDLPIEIEQFSVSVFGGYYDFDEDGNPAAGGELSYAHWGVVISRDLGEFGSLSLNYEQTDGGAGGAIATGGESAIATDDNANFWLGWSIEF